MHKPILLGMANPDPMRGALWPDPPGCSGWRLWQIIQEFCGATRQQYLDAFERENLVPKGQWSPGVAAMHGRALLENARGGRRYVVLGAATWTAMPLGPRPDPGDCAILKLCRWYFLPHPSGKNLWYNDQANRRTAGRLLADLGGLRCAA